jgi:hypothetical protein
VNGERSLALQKYQIQSNCLRVICNFMQDAASIPELELSSNRFVRFSSSKQAIQTHLPALVPAPAQPNSNTPEYMVNMTLEAVPAALALPIMVRKPLHGAIKVKLQFAAPAPCTISASMQLHALDAQHIETVQAWLPSGTQNALISGSKNVSAQLVRIAHCLFKRKLCVVKS